MASNIVRHDYNGFGISQRKADSYVNLTDMATVGDKLIADYLRLDSTKAYVSALSETMGIPIVSLIVSKTGRNGGTFAHPEIAMDCAQWVSIPLRIWANRTLVKIVAGEKPPEAPPTQIPLPPADVRTANFYAALAGFGIELDNPRYAQAIKDVVIDQILGSKALPASAEVWLGVVEKAEQMGYSPILAAKYRSQLGKFVAAMGLASKKEKRLCDGTQREINLYLDCNDLETAIGDFLDAKILSTAA